jgi:hypothetical protein
MRLAKITVLDEVVPPGLKRVNWAGTQARAAAIKNKVITCSCVWYDVPRNKPELMEFLEDQCNGEEFAA